MSIEGPNAKEAAYWSTDGRSWIEHEAVQDQLLAPVTEAVLAFGEIAPGARVLDVGCGTGAHALETARIVGAGGSVVALDVSQPFLDRVAERARAADLPVLGLLADAQTAEWDDRFDVLTSRFGVMFFADPMAAFANMAKALKPGGHMIFAAWAARNVNPWWSLPASVAAAHLGEVPAAPPNAAGPMGLADADFVREVLQGAGLTDADLTPVEIMLGSLGDARETAEHCMKIGPGARVLRMKEGTDEDRAAIVDDLTEALAAYEEDGAVYVPAVLNMIEVRVP